MQHDVRSEPGGRPGHQKIVLLVLAVLALATVFLLPHFVNEPWVGADSAGGPAVADSSPSRVAPSVAAEKTRYRQDSQAVLAKIIPIRDRLQQQNVSSWAEIEFRQAMEKIESGDQQYSYGNYAESLGSYQQALDEFTRLEAVGQQKLTTALADGQAAIESLNVVVARNASDLAGRIAAQNPEVQLLVRRTEVLPQIATLIETGDLALEMGKLEAARNAYQEAVTLDPLHQRAGQALTSARAGLTDASFRQHMSRGYAAFENGDFDAARAAFADADRIDPGNAAVSQALDQLENDKSRKLLNQQLAQAAQLEAAEEWQQAVDIYEDLLKKDASLTEAQVKIIPARVRADLDQRMNDLLEDPLKISGQAAYRQAQQLLADAQGIARPGARLAGQIELLQTRLRLVVTPVKVEFRSDRLTHVVLFKVADLGQFEQTSLTLRPGRYIAAGTRAGYRDVRVEFSITGEPMDEPITVACSEAI